MNTTNTAAKSAPEGTALRHMDEMSGHLRGILEIEGLSSFKATLTLPGAVLDMLTAAMECYDSYARCIIREKALLISCHPGCSSCCKFELPSGVMAIEALNIYHFVHLMNDIDDLYGKALKNAAAFRHLLDQEIRRVPGPMIPDDSRIQKAHIKYNSLGRPCPFLDEKSGKCRIYPVRPLVCRFYFSLSPWKWCHPDHNAYLHRQTMGIEICNQAKVYLRRINRRLGLSIANYLPGAFVTVISDIMHRRPLVLT